MAAFNLVRVFGLDTGLVIARLEEEREWTDETQGRDGQPRALARAKSMEPAKSGLARVERRAVRSRRQVSTGPSGGVGRHHDRHARRRRMPRLRRPRRNASTDGSQT